MSGSGGSTYDPEPPRQPCDRLNFKTVLNSPNPAVVGGLTPGADTLTIQIDGSGGKKRVLAAHKGSIAGSITSDMLPQLINCLEQGFPFHADVLSAKGGRVEIHVLPGT